MCVCVFIVWQKRDIGRGAHIRRENYAREHINLLNLTLKLTFLDTT